MFLGNGPKVLLIVKVEDVPGQLPCCLIAFFTGW